MFTSIKKVNPGLVSLMESVEFDIEHLKETLSEISDARCYESTIEYFRRHLGLFRSQVAEIGSSNRSDRWFSEKIISEISKGERMLRSFPTK